MNGIAREAPWPGVTYVKLTIIIAKLSASGFTRRSEGTLFKITSMLPIKRPAGATCKASCKDDLAVEQIMLHTERSAGATYNASCKDDLAVEQNNATHQMLRWSGLQRVLQG